ncbi:MAG TPA: farnesyl diphosphate synthase [Rhizomicrobium sp.]|nr:farnesyl diphosphate synthase [Rhizomicrobium sp.]
MDQSQPAAAAAASSELATALAQCTHRVEQTLDAILPRPHALHGRVHEAMRYAIFAGGKRLRPFLVLEGGKIYGVPENRALRAAAAIEAIHTYSLVHDDLPSMDDDDLRRGQPTVHKAFDEATAILAGDALLTVAFEILANPATHPSGEVRAQLVERLAWAAGSEGMIGGQMIDMQAPQRSLDADEVITLQRLKTGALFEFACEAGAILGEAGSEERERMRRYAADLGLAFQIADDLLDVTGTTEKLGKTAGKDVEQGKATLVSVYGIAGARQKAATLADNAAALLAGHGHVAALLRELPRYIVNRDS